MSAATAAAAALRPSSTRCGARESSTASLRLSGSPSAPLPITTGLRPVTEAILRPVGKPAPPRPVSPDSSNAGDQRRSGRLRQSAELLVVFDQTGTVRREQAVRAHRRPADANARVLGVIGVQPPHESDGHRQRAASGKEQKPAAAGIGPIAQCVRQRDRPQRVRRPVHGPEDPCAESVAQQAGDDHDGEQIERLPSPDPATAVGSCPETGRRSRRAVAARTGRRIAAPGGSATSSVPASAAKRWTSATANLGNASSGRPDRVAMPNASETVRKPSAVDPGAAAQRPQRFRWSCRGRAIRRGCGLRGHGPPAGRAGPACESNPALPTRG